MKLDHTPLVLPTLVPGVVGEIHQLTNVPDMCDT